MKNSKNFFDVLAALLLRPSIDWDSEYPPDGAADYFWDPVPARNKITPIAAGREREYISAPIHAFRRAAK